MTLMLLIDLHSYVTWIFPLLILYLIPISVDVWSIVFIWYYFAQQIVAFMIYFRSRVLFLLILFYLRDIRFDVDSGI